MKIAAAVELGDAAGGRVEVGDAVVDQCRVILELEVGMRGGNESSGSGIGGNFQHGETIGAGLGAVVQAP